MENETDYHFENLVKHPEGNYPEDRLLENGNYLNKCIKCGHMFVGYKRRVICKTCNNL